MTRLPFKSEMTELPKRSPFLPRLDPVLPSFPVTDLWTASQNHKAKRFIKTVSASFSEADTVFCMQLCCQARDRSRFRQNFRAVIRVRHKNARSHSQTLADGLGKSLRDWSRAHPHTPSLQSHQKYQTVDCRSTSASAPTVASSGPWSMTSGQKPYSSTAVSMAFSLGTGAGSRNSSSS